MKMLWWEEQSAMAEDYKDLEWLAYNCELIHINHWTEQDFAENTGPLSEQLWAMREGLA